MRRTGLVAGILMIVIQGYSQPDYSNEYLGWIRLIQPTDPVKAAHYDQRSFSVAQQTICNQFISWIQASYTPKGGLGEGRKTGNEKLSPYNQYTRSLHDYYGAYLPTYLFLKKKPGAGWIPENNLGHFLRILANGPVGDHIDLISSADQYYFYIPEPAPENTLDQSSAQFMSFQTHPALSRYMHFYQPRSIRFQAQYTVVISNQNVRPWLQITKGEFLDQLEIAVERAHNEQIVKIREDYNEKRRQRFLSEEELLYKKRKSILTQQREKYLYRKNEKATMYTEQPSIHLENTPDIFEGNGGTNRKIPIYKYDPSFSAGLKSGLPQWITISWGGGNMDQESYKNLHSSMLNNFDYSYVYSYFFEPEKTKGISYKPLRPPVTQEISTATRESAISVMTKAISGTVLYEDFSTTPSGKSPLNWISTNNFNGEKVKTELRDDNRNWAVLNGQQLILREQIPFPESFTFSCTIAVPKGFTWGAKRLNIKLGTDKASFLIGIRPGFDGNHGSLYPGADQYGSTILYPGILEKVKEIFIPGFSNNKPFNEFQLEIRKKGQSLEIFINQTSVIHVASAFIQSTDKIRGIEFAHSRSDAASEKYYITGILLRR